MHNLDFPESLCDMACDKETLLCRLNTFLQEAGPENGHEPLFPKDEYLIFRAAADSGFGPQLRVVAPGPQIEQSAKASGITISGPMLEFHTDTRGTYSLFERCIPVGGSLYELLVALIAYTEVSNSMDPCKRLQEAGIFTGNLWWVLNGTRTLSCISPTAFAKLTSGRSIMDFPPQSMEEMTGDICQNLEIMRIFNPDLFDQAVTDDTILDASEVCLAPKGKGCMFNSGIVFHRGSAADDFAGTSMEVRLMVVPLAFLNKLTGSRWDQVQESDADRDSLRPIVKYWLDNFEKNEDAYCPPVVEDCYSTIQRVFAS